MKHLIHHWINYKASYAGLRYSGRGYYTIAFEYFLYEKQRLIWDLITEEDRKNPRYIINLLKHEKTNKRT